MQSEMSVMGEEELVNLRGQDVHAAAPAALNLPTGHTTAVALVDPAGHTYPAAQRSLQKGLTRYMEPPHLPGLHKKQPVDDRENDPRGHDAGFKPVRAALPVTSISARDNSPETALGKLPLIWLFGNDREVNADSPDTALGKLP